MHYKTPTKGSVESKMILRYSIFLSVQFVDIQLNMILNYYTFLFGGLILPRFSVHAKFYRKNRKIVTRSHMLRKYCEHQKCVFHTNHMCGTVLRFYSQTLISQCDTLNSIMCLRKISHQVFFWRLLMVKSLLCSA